MGVDSGLPDFRGKNGFWKAYPPLEKMGIEFEEIANPHWFIENPRLAWGFYGHRLNLYKKTKPHKGFNILLKKSYQEKIPMFIFTSNVDGQFQKTGFKENQIMECHGSIMHFQCIEECGQPIWPANSDLFFEIEPEKLLANQPLPKCPDCGALARPNILMFSDFAWNQSRAFEQKENFKSWLDKHKNKKMLVIELGAGTSIPTVRLTCEDVYQSFGNQFIRVNPKESECGLKNSLSLPLGAMNAINAIS